MKAAILTILLFSGLTFTFSQETKDQITGLVTDSKQEPLALVNIIIKNTEKGTQTNEFGRYVLNGSPGDTLLFTYLGMHSHQIEVFETPYEFNVSLQSSDIEIEEVEIKARRVRTQVQLLKEYPTNKNLVKTSWGILDKEIFSGSIRIVDGDMLINVGTDFLTSLNGLLPNLKIIRNNPNAPGRVFVYLSSMAQTTNPTAFFEVDGVLQKSPPTYLLSSDIERIAVLERSSAISRYGSDGLGGVIIVNTKAQAAMDELGVDRSYEKKLLLDSMTLEAYNYENYVPFTSVYLTSLAKLKNKKKAFSIHEIQKQNHLDNPYYFLEVFDFLASRWQNSYEVKELNKEIINRFQNNVPALKTLAYLQEKYGNYKSALSVYLKILAQKTDHAQSHRDVANAFVQSGDNRKALNRYTGFGTSSKLLTSNPFDAQGEDLLMTTEIRNILSRDGNKLLDSFDVEHVEKVFQRTRLVFDWNNPGAKFDLQFINPEGYYDSWQNYPDSGSQDWQARDRRYYCEQFFLDDEIKGNWNINLYYHGNQSDFPTYLKLSIYRDYGLPSQSLEIKVYRLSEEYNKINLVQLQLK